ncbi:MAG: lipoate protein ligase C-terminal domain-containing protein [Candidatus Hodarchaeota archaeon]
MKKLIHSQGDLMSWRVVNLGGTLPLETQSLFHAAALAVSKKSIPNTLYLLWPNKPLVSVGYHQEVAVEVALDYCGDHDIPVIRRRVGGGAVYLDSNQVFYQVILHTDTPGIPKGIAEFYRKMLKAPVQVYRAFGVEAKYSPVNDIINADGRKISGNGAGQIENALVLVGNIILDFDFDKMVSVLRVPSEKFRGKMAKTLRERIGTLAMMIDQVPSRQTVIEELIRQFSKVLQTDWQILTELLDEERKLVNEINALYATKEWLFAQSYRRKHLVQQRSVRISGQRHISEGVFKAPGGLVRVTAETLGDKLQDVLISGDFSMRPSDAIAKIEDALKGTKINQNILKTKLTDIFQQFEIDAPGLSPQDIAKVIYEAITGR